MVATTGAPWLFLIHQIPPKPPYLRVKVWRRLHGLGAVAIKNSVYVLPNTDEAREDLEWVLREIVKDGGEATLCETRLVDGLSDDQIHALFHVARDADYKAIADEARRIGAKLPRRSTVRAEQREQLPAEVARLRRRLAATAARDFFGAPGREAAEGLVSALESRLRVESPSDAAARERRLRVEDFRGRTWVTRKGIHVDRMASAWLVRRFIDPEARFKFVPGRGYSSEAGEVRFDMFEAEFTHEGDRCTFEVLLARLGPDNPALGPIAQIVHDIDLKDARFDRPEVTGIERLVAGIAMAHRDDESRLSRGAAVFDDLYEYFTRKRG